MSNQSPPFRAIVTDIDGTIVDSRKQLTAFTRHELRRVTSGYGIHLILASTRMPASLRHIQGELGIAGPIVAYNGALAIHPSDTSVGYSSPLDDSVALSLVNHLLSQQVHVGVFSLDRWFVTSVDYWALREIRGTCVWPHGTPLKTAIEAGAIFPVHKIMIRGEAGTLSRAVERVMTSFDNISVGRDRETIVEFTGNSTSKAIALKQVLDWLGISASSVIAFGDGVSDIGMLKLAGMGIAVYNASEAVRSASDEVTLSSDEDGVGYALRKYFPVVGHDSWPLPSASD